MVCVGISMI